MRRTGAKITAVLAAVVMAIALVPALSFAAIPSAAVTYYPNGGTEDTIVEFADARSTTDLSSEYEIKNGTAFSFTGYTMTGWNTSADGSGTSYAFGAKPFDQTDIQGLTLYAQWRPNTYTVKFDANGGTGTITDQAFTYDVEQNLTTNIASIDTDGSTTYTISREGYDFVGWNTVANPTEDEPGAAYPDSYPVKNLTAADGEVVTLYAQWESSTPAVEPDIYVVTFNENAPEAREDGGAAAKDVIQLLYPNDPDPMKLMSLDDIKDEVKGEDEDADGGYDFPHYDFNGWNTEADGSGAQYADGADVSSDDDLDGVTLYAQWEAKKFEVTFQNYDGTELLTTNVAYGETPEYPDEMGDPTRNDTSQYKYSFTGWTPELVPVSGNAIYKATYSESLQEYTIMFGIGDEYSTVDVAYGEMPEFDGATPTKEGTEQYSYEFVGWDPDLEPVTMDAIYNAKFEQKPHEHDWGDWVVTKKPTCTDKGVETRTCKSFSNHSETREVDALGHDWGAWKVVKKPTALNAGVKQRVCKNDPKHVQKKSIRATGASGVLLAKVVAKGSDKLSLTWTKVTGAEGYDVFFSPCNTPEQTNVPKKVATLKGEGALSWERKGLKKGFCYKMYVKAWAKKDGKKKYLKRSPTVHGYAGNYSETRTNAKSVTVKKSSVSLRVGKSYKVKASVVKLKTDRMLISDKHAPTLRYMSSNAKVATVSKSGKIVAKGKGKCKVYVYTTNGVRKAVKVTVS